MLRLLNFRGTLLNIVDHIPSEKNSSNLVFKTNSNIFDDVFANKDQPTFIMFTHNNSYLHTAIKRKISHAQPHLMGITMWYSEAYVPVPPKMQIVTPIDVDEATKYWRHFDTHTLCRIQIESIVLINKSLW